MDRLTVEDIRQTCPPGKWDFVAKSPYSLAMRKLSFYITWLFIKMGISADGATYLSISVGLLGCVLLAIGHYPTLVGGAILINIWYLLDCVNGNIARYQRVVSDYGEFVDDTSGYLMYALVFTGLGIGIYRHTDNSLAAMLSLLSNGSFSAHIDKGFFLMAGSAAALSFTLRKVVGGKFTALFRAAAEPDESREQRAPSHSRKRSRQALYLLRWNITSFSGLVLPLLLLNVLCRTCELFITFYAFLYGSWFCTSYLRRIISARRKGL